MPEGTPHATGNWLIRSRPMSLKQMLSAKLVAHVSLYSMKMCSEQDLLLSVVFREGTIFKLSTMCKLFTNGSFVVNVFFAASFEVMVNGKLIFSKLEQGSFPSFKEVS